MKNLWLVAALCTLPLLGFSQEDSTVTEEPIKNWALRGYIKDLRTVYFLPNLNTIQVDNFIHNRLFFEWYPSERLTFKADLRSRIFYGNTFSFMPLTAYTDLVRNANNDFFDLSATLIEKNGLLFHTMIDRLFVDYTMGKWQITAGRQRINWGINTLWNPNDIFNSYNFTDFDYEERPGSDALRVQYYTGATSSIEIAVKAFDKKENIVAGALWKFNQKNYDFQILGGVAKEDIVLGGGWAGSLGQIGFKGEFSSFLPYQNLGDSVSTAATLGFDYAFDNSLFLSAGFLWNSNGTKDSLDLTGGGLLGSTGTLSAKNLYPYRYAFSLSAGYPFTPILSGALAVVYSPSEDKAMFFSPSLTYSMKDNLDLAAVGQFFALNIQKQYTMPSKALFVRLKWNF